MSKMKCNPSFLMILNLIQFFFAAYECHVISGREVDETVKMTEKKLPPKIDLSKQEDSESDIHLLRKSPIDGNERSAVHNDYIWPNGKIPFVISVQYNETEVKIIKDAMNAISGRTCIKFVARKNQEDYIFIEKDGTSKCNSPVGNNGGMGTMLLNDNCMEYTQIIKHELMHLVGFHHEQNRPDRDDYVEINWEYIEPGTMEDNFKKFSLKEVQLLGTTYDLKSIMQYSYQFSKYKDKDTITAKNGDRLKPSKDFTLTDVLDMNLLYNCSDVIRWKEQSLDIGTFAWKENYEFDIGDNIYKGKTSKSADCGRLCVANVRCTHFNWYSDGVCKLQTNHIKKYSKALPRKGAICGFVQVGNSADFEWTYDNDGQELRSYGCVIPGDSIEYYELEKDTNDTCFSRCIDNVNCTNYFVKKSEKYGNMIDCYLLAGKNPIASFYSNKKTDYCSIIPARVLNGY